MERQLRAHGFLPEILKVDQTNDDCMHILTKLVNSMEETCPTGLVGCHSCIVAKEGNLHSLVHYSTRGPLGRTKHHNSRESLSSLSIKRLEHRKKSQPSDDLNPRQHAV